MSRTLLRHTQEVPKAFAREHDFPCIGILLELENEVAGTLQVPQWRIPAFTHIGKANEGWICACGISVACG